MPEIAWPSGLRVYTEPTQVRLAPSNGWIGGEKHFRFTVVAESAGVVTLPAVSYPYFDPGSAHVAVARAAELSLPVVPVPPGTAARQALPVSTGAGVPWATALVQAAWPVLLLVVIAAPLLVLVLRRERRTSEPAPLPAEAEGELRLLLATPADAGPERVVAALRHRGINRQDAEQIRRWLAASLARRYGRNHPVGPPPPPALQRALARLRRPAAFMLLLLLARPLAGQTASAVGRYRGGDYAGAAREFAALVAHDPEAANAWRDLGSARWMARDDVGATAAWLRAMLLAPRDPLTALAWRQADAVPADVRALAPTVPLSRDELLVLAVAALADDVGADRRSVVPGSPSSRPPPCLSWRPALRRAGDNWPSGKRWCAPGPRCASRLPRPRRRWARSRSGPESPSPEPAVGGI